MKFSREDKTKMAVDLFDKYANTYEEKYMSVDLYIKSLDIFCSKIKPANAKILDLACGPGNITRHLLSVRPDFDILGTDLADSMISLAKKNNPTAHFELKDCRDFHTYDQKFDGIICGFGLPYISKEDALNLIENAATKLNTGGLLYLSTMEDDYDKSGLVGPSSGGNERLYMYYHQANYLIEAMKMNGFGEIEVERITYDGNDGRPVTDLILIGNI